MKYCNECGAGVVFKIPDGDERPRYVCEQCGTIHYKNPKIVAGVLATLGKKILICRRAVGPRKGFWTFPAGFMESQETVAQAAARETLEEANAVIDKVEPYAVVSLPYIDQVYILYRAELIDGKHSPGMESLETKLIDIEEIPWDALAFEVIKKTLLYYRDDNKKGEYPVRDLCITKPQLKQNI